MEKFMAVFRPIDKILKGIFLTVFVLCGILFIAFTVRWMLHPGQESQMNYGNSLLYFRARSFADGGSSVRAGCHVLLSSFIVGYAVLSCFINRCFGDKQNSDGQNSDELNGSSRNGRQQKN